MWGGIVCGMWCMIYICVCMHVLGGGGEGGRDRWVYDGANIINCVDSINLHLLPSPLDPLPHHPQPQILIQGPNARLIIGTEASPFTHHVVLTLTGRRSDDDLPLTRRLNLGSKAIGVFGNVCNIIRLSSCDVCVHVIMSQLMFSDLPGVG